MGLGRTVASGLLRYFTTDQAVRAGIITAAWAGAASFSRGILPRTPVQQAAITGVSVASYYALGTTTWATVSSVAAGTPGSRPGAKAKLVAASTTAAGGKFAEVALRPRSGDSLIEGIEWSEVKLLSVAGLAGGLVTVSDLLAHEVFGRRRTPFTTLGLDLAMGTLMASGTLTRRLHRAHRYHDEDPPTPAVKKAKAGTAVAVRARTAAVAGATVVGSTAGLAALAVTEQAGARLTARAVNALAGQDLKEFSDFVGHGVMFTGLAGLGVVALRQVRNQTQKKSEVLEPAYRDDPTSRYVSCGPRSEIAFDAIGKEGRRFVLMRLSPDEITGVMGGQAEEPVRVVIPREGSIEERARLAVRELAATGGLERGIICIASPTGVGYVNYVMAEALEYLSRGDCAVVVPQYAYVPSALALNKTSEGVELQTAVIEAVVRRLDELAPPNRPRVVQFGESLGAQVAADVGGAEGVPRFDGLGLEAGLFCGVPFRSRLWKQWLQDSDEMSEDGRLSNVARAGEIRPGPRQHVMINHHDDPINKFSYEMAVRRPWWFGPPETRPPKVPREILFRPVISFVIALVDLVNGMDSKPGEFRLLGHDYRIDMREAIEKTYGLPATTDQQDRIESALRRREQDWAEKRLIARTGEKALRQLRDTINSWGQDAVNLDLRDIPAADEASSRLIEYLNAKMGQSGSSGLA
ncbi:MAG: alpha/beta-hydrolase family protein [Candidatus Nanopelagicales bacterium]